MQGPKRNRLNQDNPKASRKICIHACVGCGICARGFENDEMTLENNLARIDYSKYGQGKELPTSKCPTQALILISAEKTESEAAA